MNGVNSSHYVCLRESKVSVEKTPAAVPLTVWMVRLCQRVIHTVLTILLPSTNHLSLSLVKTHKSLICRENGSFLLVCELLFYQYWEVNINLSKLFESSEENSRSLHKLLLSQVYYFSRTAENFRSLTYIFHLRRAITISD